MPHSPHEQTLLQLRAAQAGDRVAVEELFARYRDRLLHIVSLLRAKRRSDLAEDEEDVVQNTLLRAFQHLQGFEPQSNGAFLHWLSKLAENDIRNARRGQRTLKRGDGRVRPFADLPRSALYSSLFPGLEPAPSEVARAHELAERIESAVIALPERERRAFVLRRLCDLSFAEIAADLGLGGASSARSLYSRVLGRLSSRISAPLEP